MHRTSSRFCPQLVILEDRLAPAVTVTAFKSNPTALLNDSLLITGTRSADLVQVTDDGASVAITANGQPIPLPLTDPVIVRINLRQGNDQLEYIVPNPVELHRKIEYTGGAGRNSFRFDNLAVGGAGVSLNSGSVVGIDYSGTQGRAQGFRTRFNQVTGAAVTLSYVFGRGNDRDVAVEFLGNIGGDSNVATRIDLGAGTARATQVANDLNLILGDGAGDTIGSGDSSGTRLAFDVTGGGRSDQVAVRLGVDSLGTVGGAATEVAVNANLGGGADNAFLASERAPTLLPNSKLAFTVHGNGGGDNLAAFTDIGAGLLTLADTAQLELGLFGDTGNDFMEVDFGLSPAGDLQLGAGALFRLLMNGQAGNDLVAARLANTAASDTAAVYDVRLLGEGGNDTMGLSVQVNGATPTIAGGAALLDGGLGSNTVDQPPLGFGIGGPVQRLNV